MDKVLLSLILVTGFCMSASGNDVYVIVRELVGVTGGSQRWVFSNYTTALSTKVGNGLVPNLALCDSEYNPCSEIGSCNKLDQYLVNCSCPTGHNQAYDATMIDMVDILIKRTICKDINECTENPTICGADSTGCVNTPGSYQCTCKTGYNRSAENKCQDIDECADTANNVCGAHSVSCKNTLGHYVCTCATGYDFADNTTCKDIDECSNATLNHCAANASCSNTLGSYNCKCNEGYQGNGTHCQDINECSNGVDQCGNATATCINQPGTFTCTCDQGFVLNSHKNCVDKDECKEAEACSDDSKCSNTYGSYMCNCNSGYHGSGTNCTDIDECIAHTDNCHTNATCVNFPGSFYCRCDFPFAGDGQSCEEIPCKPLTSKASFFAESFMLLAVLPLLCFAFM